MSTTQIDIRFEGDNFYPSLLKKETNLPIEILVEKNQISPRGQYKGKPSPYGIALLKIDDQLGKKNPIEILEEYITLLLNFKNLLEKSGVEEITFDIETSNSKEYNFSIESEIMKKLLKLNARIDFHGNESEIALDSWLEEYSNLNKTFLSKQQTSRFQIIRNKIIHTSPHIHVYDLNRIYWFMLIYVIKYMENKEDDIPSFEAAYKKYSLKD